MWNICLYFQEEKVTISKKQKQKQNVASGHQRVVLKHQCLHVNNILTSYNDSYFYAFTKYVVTTLLCEQQWAISVGIQSWL